VKYSRLSHLHQGVKWSHYKTKQNTVQQHLRSSTTLQWCCQTSLASERGHNGKSC